MVRKKFNKNRAPPASRQKAPAKKKFAPQEGEKKKNKKKKKTSASKFARKTRMRHFAAVEQDNDFNTDHETNIVAFDFRLKFTFVECSLMRLLVENRENIIFY